MMRDSMTEGRCNRHMMRKKDEDEELPLDSGQAGLVFVTSTKLINWFQFCICGSSEQGWVRRGGGRHFFTFCCLFVVVIT